MTSAAAPEGEHSPLGRYGQCGGEDLHEVRLLGVPVKLLAAGREHHDELLREFAVMALDEAADATHVPVRLLELVDVLGRRYGAASTRPDAEIDAALHRGQVTIDLVYQVPAHAVEAADQLEALMAEADEFCRQEKLLALARPAVVVEFSRWYLDQFRIQIAGGEPVPWIGPLEVD